MSGSVSITIQGEREISFSAQRGENVLFALTRAGVVVSAPCGGRGICGKCCVTLLKGTVCLDTGVEVKTGDVLCACRATALSDITLAAAESDFFESGFDHALAEMAVRKKILHTGVGLDIGTTTVQAQLVDLDTGEPLETFSAVNRQCVFGADVISRISAARDGKLNELFNTINRQVEEILRQFINRWNLKKIEKCVVSGNTVMLHLFCGADPSAMGAAPFTPVFLEERHFSGEELSLSADQVTLLPGISAFVGADIVSGLALIDVMNGKDSLFVDIGTNGEMAVWKESEKRLLCCSTAAGPCFEGAEISCGMSAALGAINRIYVNDKSLLPTPRTKGSNSPLPISYTTLGNEKARGICGAGLIDAIAVMKKLDAIDETGTLADEFVKTGFPLAENVVITQKDVRLFQLAKAAVFSGSKVLCKTAGLETADVDTAYIAGGLGFFIDLKNAASVGLLPAELAKKAAVCGNTNLKGAVKCLIDSSFSQKCREIAACASTVELAHKSDFAEMFAESMLI